MFHVKPSRCAGGARPRSPPAAAAAARIRGGRTESWPRPAVDPRPDGGQPEGRRRQDHHHGQHRRRAGPARPAGARDRPRPAGQRLHGAGGRAPRRGADVYDVLVDGEPLADVRSTRSRRSRGSGCVPATIDLAGAEIELVSWSRGRAGCQRALTVLLRESSRGRRPLRLRLHRLPALAGPAHPQRLGRRPARC